MKPKTSQPREENREFFRIDDEVVLQFRPIKEQDCAELQQTMAERLPSVFGLCARFAAMDQRTRGLIKEIESQSPAVASYLGAIDEKLGILARALLAQELEPGDQPTQHVNLSAGGVAFDVERPLPEGQLLELRLVLLPAFTGIMTHARVVHCQRLADSSSAFRHRVAVEFHTLRDEDRDIIASHVFQRQAEAARARRQYRGTD